MEIVKISNRGTMFIIETKKKWCVNCYLLVSDNKNYVIDTGCGDIDGKLLLDYINDNPQCKDKEIIVVNTHSHFDHVWGNHIFKDCKIIAHKECYNRYVKHYEYTLNQFKDLINNEVEFCPPNILLDDELYFEKEKVRVFPSLGHSTDGLCILDEIDKVLYVGDNIGDTPDEVLPELELTKEEYLKEIVKLQNYNFNTLASGHNIIQSKDFLKRIVRELNK